MSRNTILSQKEADLLEALIAKYGLVVSFSQIFKELKKKKSKQEIYNLTSKLSKAGWLVRIRRGVYYIASLESRGMTSLSIFAIAHLIEEDSYVSFEAALQYHGMFDQYLRTVRSVTLKKSKSVTIQNIEYEFIHTGNKLFYGFGEDREEGQKVRVASAEKAILDILHFKRTDYMLDVVLEKLRCYRDTINWEELLHLVEKQNLSVKRTLGFLLDKLAVDTTKLYQTVQGVKGYSRLTQKSQRFNAKWRLYYSNQLNKQLI